MTLDMIEWVIGGTAVVALLAFACAIHQVRRTPPRLYY